MMKLANTISQWVVLGAMIGTLSHNSVIAQNQPETYELQKRVITTLNGVTIYNGGFGSGMARSKQDPSLFYFMTDRGPNFDGQPGEKVFPVPTFSPAIAIYQWTGSELIFKSRLNLRDENNRLLTGLPNPVGVGGTGEIPVFIDSSPLPLDPKGIDPEGITLMADNSFWVADEYGPHLIHFDLFGKTIERINPFGNGPGGRKLPMVLAHRRANRGMEGLTSTPDGAFLVGIMQSSLDNPTSDRAAIRRNSATTRIVLFHIETGATQQYLYMQEAPALSNSEIRALSNHEFIVLERDGNFPGDPATGSSSLKRFYKIDIREATDVSDPQDGPLGLTFDINGVNKTLEQMSLGELLRNGVVPVRKELYLDVIEAIPGYPHDKMEGFEILEDGRLAIINDDDFGVIDADGQLAQKVLPANGNVDSNILYVVGRDVMQPALDVNQLGTYATGIDGESAAEIISYDPLAQRAFISNSFQNGIDVVDIRNPNNPKLIMEIKNLGGNVNSVSVKNGIVAVAVENENPQMNGSVVFLDVLTGSILNRLPVGPMPDTVTFSPDGTMVVTANEGEPNSDYTIDPKGSISIIYLGSGSIVETVLANESDVTTVGFEAYDFLVDFFLEAGIRIFGEIRNPRTGEFLRYSRPSEDFEPEFVAVSEDSRTAYVTMQENNAIAVIDLVQGQLIDLIPLGYKDHSVPGSGLDASDVDGGINIRPWPVKGMYLPDAIATYETLGRTFLVIANEGDSRDYDGFSEEARVRDLNLDPTAFPNAEELQMPGNLGRLKTTTTMGDLDGDGDYDEIYTFGARSFSILDEHGNIIWDSGDQFEQIIADLDPFHFNISPFDGRSDDKGPEPEGLALGTINGRKYAFIGLERQSAVMVYDITYPYEPTFVRYIKNRSGDVSPEGLVFVDSELSPTGEPMLLVANEVSGSTTFNNIHINPVREFKMQILHSSDNESSFQDPNTLEPKILHYGAIVDGLQALAAREGIPSIHVTAGDHTLPSQFYQASEEAFGARGLGDIMFFNAMGLVANGIGNHEFDGGINDFARMLNIAEYPFIAANLDFSQVQLESETPAIRRGIDGGSVEENAGKVVKSAYVMAGGEKIGLIGRAPADFFNVIADPDTTIPGLDFVGGRNPDNNQPLVSALTQVLEQVALLEAQGINKIILLDHAQDFTGDPLSASNLSGIDIIVAAGSTGFMADSEPNGPFNLLRPGNSPSADYPTVREDADGNTVLVVNSDQLFSYVGNLIVGFDHMGHINHIDDRSGPIATTEDAVMALDQLLPGYDVRASDEVQDIYSQLIETPLILDLFDVIGITSGALNGNRADVRSRETNLGRLAADSTLWFAQEWVKSEGLPMEVDVALKNGGGIRNSIVGPVITKLAVATALAFDNKLAIMELSGAELIAAMENAVSRNPSLDGRFPQIAGMDLEFVPALPGVSDQITLSVPSRIRRLVIHRANGTDDVLIDNFMAQGDLTRQFTLATNDFLSTGGDGYRVFQAVSEDPARGALRPPVGERQILSEYIELALNGEVDIPDPLPTPRVRAVQGIQQLYNASLKPFYHGVASGDPSSSGVILWTRITPENPNPVDVVWEVSESMEFTSITRTGIFTTDANRDFTVKVPVDGLNPATVYYYRFIAPTGQSMVGRTRTAPAAGVSALKFAVVSCVNYEAGFFSGFRHIAEMDDIDAVIHLGDSIYEYGRGGYSNPILAQQRQHFPPHEIVTLGDYRERHANYALDKDLMMARASFPFIMIWDDHEVANNGWKDGAENHDETTEGDYTTRKANGVRAFHEWNPTSVDGLRIYRALKFGNLVDLFMIDTRHIGRQRQMNDITEPALFAADRTILGPTQKQWLKDQLTASTAKWKLIGNQVHFSEVNYWWAGPAVGQTPQELESTFLDAWDGYPAERTELIQFIQNGGIQNLVFLTGDSHTSWAFDVVDKVDTLNPASDLLTRYNPSTGDGAVAVEFGTPSITSANFDEIFIGQGQSPEQAIATAAGFEVQINNPIQALGGLNPNPHLKYVDLDRHGFIILTVTESETKADFYYVSNVVDPNASVELGKSLSVAAGAPRIPTTHANDGFSNWISARLTSHRNDQDQDLDIDQDGLSNYEEFLYGTNPAVADKASVSIRVENGAVTISYFRNSTANAQWSYQTASSLNGSWTTLAEVSDYSLEVTPVSTELEKVTVTMSGQIDSTQFFRIVAR